MTLSIRYDLAFQESLVRYTDDQLEPDSNPDGQGPTLRQEQRQNQSLMLLCDMIDLYVERRIQEAQQEARAKG